MKKARVMLVALLSVICLSELLAVSAYADDCDSYPPYSQAGAWCRWNKWNKKP